MIDPLSLREGDKVEVCLCDTSASCVWSFPAVALMRNEELVLEATNEDYTNYRGEKALPVYRVDNCYTYLTEVLDRK